MNHLLSCAYLCVSTFRSSFLSLPNKNGASANNLLFSEEDRPCPGVEEVPLLKEQGLQPVRGDSCFILSGASSLLLFLIFEMINSLILLRIESQIPLEQRNLNTVELIISPTNLLSCVPFLKEP